ncbi:MAG: NAD-dependent epimerase/dehydratase family protein [Gemmatimonadetes bacterium]|nr:NAD-dependent epimerase/dehydratase family protein [Gemmatimonadota bacterium]
MKKVLVTGASGFTGSHLCRRLVAEGAEVVAFVRPTSRIGPLVEMGVECRIVDISDPEVVRRSFDGIATVYHLAAAYREEHADHSAFRRVNVEATRNLLEAAQAAGVERFVHCSTVGVQGEIEEPPATEEYRFRPGDHYQQSKLEGELLAREYTARRLPVSVVRPVGIYGPGDTRFLKLFRGIARRRFVMIGSGEVLYHLTYIDDLVDGFLLAGSRPEALGEVFTIGGVRYTTLNELVRMIAATLERPTPRLRIPFGPVYAASVACEKLCGWLGVSPPLYPRRVEFFSKDRAFDISKARRLLGYEPRVDLEDGLLRTAAWYRQQGLI